MKHFILLTIFLSVFVVARAVEVGKRFDSPEVKKSVAAVDGKDDGSKDEDKQNIQNRWMKTKLKNAQNIFAGLTAGDFERIEKSAGMMYGSGILEKWLGAKEFAGHYAYEGQNNAFEYSLKELRRHAKERDINGAMNAYVMMSQSCVRCHSLVRDAEE